MNNDIPNNFIDLIKKYKIQIPIIQRDYVQGRPKEVEIRKNFINNIFHVLKEEKEELSLDFIYGRVTRDNIFEPIDGQQRLTTLFLTTYFIAIKENIEEIEEFKEFSYAVRNSSEEFCNEFSKNLKSIPEGRKIKEYIKDQKWFDEEWENDQTIMSMLEMLNLIEIKYDEIRKPNLYNKIKNIKFKFIDTEKEKLNDDTYIKLNARGIPLSSFEEYKACFLEIRNDDKELAIKMDIKWNNWLWEKIDKEKYKKNNVVFDNAFAGIFKAIFTNQYALENQISRKDDSRIEILKEFTDSDKISFSKFKEELKDINSSIEDTIKIFDFIIDNQIMEHPEINVYINSKELMEKLIYDKNKFGSNPERLEFYAICLYAIQNYNNILNEENYIQWTRIARNLIPRHIDDNMQFTRIIDKIDNLFEKIKNKENYLEAFSKIIIEKEQVENLKEEIVKARVMLLNSKNNWKEMIEKTDLKKSLAGETEFLLDFCGMETGILNDNVNNETECFKKYENYVNLFEIIFENEEKVIINEKLDKDKILTRALFALTDVNNNSDFDLGYIISMANGNTSFLVNSADRDYSWRNLFKEKNYNQRLYFKKLMDILIKENAYGIDKIIEVLNNIIEKCEINNWKKYFIKSSEIFSMLNDKNNLLRIYRQNNKNKYNIFLMKSRLSSGNTLPLFFYAIDKKIGHLLNIKCDNKDIQDAWTQGIYYNHEKWINEINGKEVLIQVDNTNEQGEFMYYKKLENLNSEERAIVENALSEIEKEFEIVFE